MGNYIKNLKNIIEGWSNYLFDNKEIKELAESRAAICASCPLNVNNICSKQMSGQVVETFVYNEQLRIKGSTQKGCSCPLSAKTRSPESKCPLNKW